MRASWVLLLYTCLCAGAVDVHHRSHRSSGRSAIQAEESSCKPEMRAKMDLCKSWLEAYIKAPNKWANICRSAKSGFASGPVGQEMCQEVATALTADEVTKAKTDESALRLEVVEGEGDLSVVCLGRLNKYSEGTIAPSCLHGPKGSVTCLMLHGSGQRTPSKLKHAGSRVHFKRKDEYWGDLSKLTHCNRVVMYFTESIQREWTDPSLSAEMCSAINTVGANLLITHSMSSMVIGSGVARRDPGCDKIGKGDSDVHWYTDQGTLKGLDATYVRKICAKKPWKLTSLEQALHKAVTVVNDYCAAERKLQTVSLHYTYRNTHKASKPDACTIQYVCDDKVDPSVKPNCCTLEDIARRSVSGSLCGVSPKGYGSVFKRLTGFVLGTLADDVTTTDVKTRYDGSVAVSGSDGLVHFETCRIGGVEYMKDPNSRFYGFNSNHLCGTGVCGDAKGPGRRPLTWMNNMAKLTREANKRAFIASMKQQTRG